MENCSQFSVDLLSLMILRQTFCVFWSFYFNTAFIFFLSFYSSPLLLLSFSPLLLLPLISDPFVPTAILGEACFLVFLLLCGFWTEGKWVEIPELKWQSRGGQREEKSQVKDKNEENERVNLSIHLCLLLMQFCLFIFLTVWFGKSFFFYSFIILNDFFLNDRRLHSITASTTFLRVVLTSHLSVTSDLCMNKTWQRGTLGSRLFL